jgi:hypothetical protein
MYKRAFMKNAFLFLVSEILFINQTDVFVSFIRNYARSIKKYVYKEKCLRNRDQI